MAWLKGSLSGLRCGVVDVRQVCSSVISSTDDGTVLDELL